MIFLSQNDLYIKILWKIYLFDNIQNLYFKYKSRIGRDFIASATNSVTQFGRNIQDIFTAFLHQLQTFSKAFNDLRRRESSACIGIELGSVDQSSFVRYFRTLIGLSIFFFPPFFSSSAAISSSLLRISAEKVVSR